jgi:hypothetical protein
VTVFTDAELMAALKETAGIKAHAAERLGVSRSAVTQRMTPEIEAFIEHLGETLVDAAEGVVAEALIKKDRGMAKWFLAHYPRAKARGWGTRTELTGPDGGPVPVAGALHVTVEYVGAPADPGDVV